MTEDEMVGCHHRLSGHGFGQTLAVSDGQGGLACCSPWGCKELDTTELKLIMGLILQYIEISTHIVHMKLI